MEPRVFVTQESSKLNYLPAEQFGKVVFLTRQEYSPIRGSIGNQHLIASIRQQLSDFDPERDFITMSGSPVIAGIVFMILGQTTNRLNVLRWSNRDHVYQHLVIEL